MIIGNLFTRNSGIGFKVDGLAVADRIQEALPVQCHRPVRLHPEGMGRRPSRHDGSSSFLKHFTPSGNLFFPHGEGIVLGNFLAPFKLQFLNLGSRSPARPLGTSFRGIVILPKVSDHDVLAFELRTAAGHYRKRYSEH